MLIKNLVIFTFLVAIFPLSSANNCTTNETTFISQNGFWSVSLIFNCFQNTQNDPLFPEIFRSNAAKYNHIDLSPNRYTRIPIEQLCQFKSLISLDLSFNLISSTRNAFRDLNCLTSLNSINLANNLINSPILSTDFDDGLSSRLQLLNLTKNMIEFIESRVFIKSNGLTRFPNLQFLGLAYNKLKHLDLLWPLTIPNLNLHIDLKYNNISLLVNELNLKFNDPMLRYPMINNRKLDATTNSLQGFDDQNLLQYGIENPDDLKEFLYKISNYDFRQSNLVPTFICFCPPGGQLTLLWFNSISNLVNRSSVIFKLYCINSPSIYVLDFPCGFSTQFDQRTTLIFSTLQFNSNSTNNPDFANLLATTTSNSSSNQIETEYFYLLFLIIPIFIILLFLLFLFCIGRFLQVRTKSLCNFVICPCLRPKEKYSNQGYDAIVCFNEIDEVWAEKLVSSLNETRNLNIALLNVLEEKSSKYFISKLQNSLRIIVIVSPKFFEKEFRHKQFLSYLKALKQNKNLVIILINKGVEKTKFNKVLKFLESDGDSFKQNLKKFTSLIRYNLGIKQVEELNYYDKSFWLNFYYLMPFAKNEKFNRDHEYNQSLKKIKTRKPIKPKNNDFNLSYASDFKDGKNLKNIIIPIPDFMRTSLGFSKQKNFDSLTKKKKHEKINFENNIKESYQNVSMEYKEKKSLHYDEEKSDNRNNLEVIKMDQNVKNSEKASKVNRSESADILAMFAPVQNIIYPLKHNYNDK